MNNKILYPNCSEYTFHISPSAEEIKIAKTLIEEIYEERSDNWENNHPGWFDNPKIKAEKPDFEGDKWHLLGHFIDHISYKENPDSFGEFIETETLEDYVTIREKILSLRQRIKSICKDKRHSEKWIKERIKEAIADTTFSQYKEDKLSRMFENVKLKKPKGTKKAKKSGPKAR